MSMFGLEIGNGLDGIKSDGQNFLAGVKSVCSGPCLEFGYRSGWVENLYVVERGLWIGGRQNGPWQNPGGGLSPSHWGPD